MKKKIKNPIKVTLQSIIIALLGYMLVRWGVDKAYTPDFEAFCPFGGIQAYLTYFSRGTLACSMSLQQIAMGAALVIGIVLFSKLFCGYICPLGTFSEWLGKIGNKIKRRKEITGIADKVLRSLKYILLFVTVYFTVGSSELFCKNYDPFFASFTLFNTDVTVWMAILSIAIFVLGSVFYRFFWCKYLCPLGAISNIFKFFIMFAGVTGVYILLITVFNLEISVVWPLAIVTVTGYILEIRGLKSKAFPVVKVTKDKDVCNDCSLCDKACPQGIKVSEYEKVTHIDCNLCGDCLHACNKKGALGLNGKKNLKWLPGAVTVLLIALGIYFGNAWKLATIDLKWGNEKALQEAEVYTRAGLKNIKCYGSSMAFAQQMQQVKGILGVTTYASNKAVEIYYHPDYLTPEKITKEIFASVHMKLQKPDSTISNFKVVSLGILKYFDEFDAMYVRELLKQFGGVYGFETKHGEPVETKIYFAGDRNVDLAKLKEHLEADQLSYKIRDFEKTVNLEFEIVEPKIDEESISREEFERRMYPEYYRIFNDRNKYTREQIDIYEVPMEMVDRQDGKIMYLQNHVANKEKGVVAMESYMKGLDPVLRVYFVKDLINADKVWEEISCDSIQVRFRSGEVKTFANPVPFKNEGEVLD